MTARETLDKLLLGQDSRQRQDDAWDLLDSGGKVAAVLCPRPSISFVSIALPPGPDRPRPIDGGPRVKPYDEKVVARVAEDVGAVSERWPDEPVLAPDGGIEFIHRLAEMSALPRGEWIGIASMLASPT